MFEKFDYKIEKSLIAQKPAHPRDSAKLLVYNRQTGEVQNSTFKNLAKFLPQNAVLVFNQTKVIPARLETKKITGGKIEVLYISTQKGLVRAMLNKKTKAGEKLFITPKLYLTVQGRDGKYYLLKPSFAISKIQSVLEKYGRAPLPPYINSSPLSKREQRAEYQTVFAKITGSIAAPTASLHFTKSLLHKLKKAGIELRYVTLHVGLGTFAPITDENIKTGRLHEEWYSIDKATAHALEKAKKQGRPIIAVGTTVVRTLESATDKKGKITKLTGNTDLFIREGYKFKMVSSMITNFHVPQSSLLMLVSAFTGRDEIMKLYHYAIKKEYRFFSFGDGMLIT